MSPEQIKNIPDTPLAERIRPKTIEEFQGQEHLLGKGKPVRIMIEQDVISSFILWGPPGTGKTTIAKLIAKTTESHFHQINAVSSGVKEVRQIIKSAEEFRKINQRTILFIDEIHRFNKNQQDALLGAVESGVLTLIGATTENPSFEVIPALRSRMRIYTLSELNAAHMRNIITQAIEQDEFLSQLPITEVDKDYLIYISGGDARIMLNVLEAAITQEMRKESISITKTVVENVVQNKNLLYDKGGEEHYNVISAFIKSVRGSDPDGAIYWLARMIAGGEDPLFIARRLVILASEDVGNAAPNGLVLAEACFSAVHQIGMPEARIILAQCTTYLASAPKSNASYLAIDEALAEVKQHPNRPVPYHLRNAPTKLMKEIGYGKDYKYPHDYDQHFLREHYLPDGIQKKQFYHPTDLGQEKQMRERLKVMWKDRKEY